MADWKTFVLNEKNQWMDDDDVLIHFEEISYEEGLKHASYTMAAHALLYAKDPGTMRWSNDKKHAAVLMQNRYDGQHGFPGGILEKDLNEPPEVGLNRELEEEIKFDVYKHAIKQENFIMSNVNHKKQLVTFFYAKEVSLDELCEIERRTLGAMEWGHETMGTLRVPLFHLKCTKWAKAKGLPLFLTNRFAGNAKIQLLETIKRLKIIPEEEFESTIRAYVDYCTPKQNSVCSDAIENMSTWKAFVQNEKNQWMDDDDRLINYEEVSYEDALKHTDYIMASHALVYAKDPEVVRWSETEKKHAAILMQNRCDGDIGFPGGILEKELKEHPVDGLNRELEEEIGLDVSKHALKQENFVMSNVNHKIQLVTFFYAKEIPMDDLRDIERRTLGAMDWGHEAMGTVRVPLIQVNLAKRDKGEGLPMFLTNRFCGNAKLQLLETIKRLSIVPEEYLETVLRVYMDYCTPKGNS